MCLKKVNCVFHYIPLHSSIIGKKIGRVSGDMTVTEDIAERLVRLPIWLEIDSAHVSQCVNECLL